jgi:V/A-type H+-transporting ATPase subunit I
MEITDIYFDNSIFHQQKQSEVEYFVAEDMQLAKEALQVLDTYCDKKSKVSSLTGRKLITTEKYEDYESKYNQIKERA